ncbi:hypothetical protein NHX12_031923 [Muraenolepis orangiensis]|uniref:Cytochrome c oxidase subunit n=1 Tax=Muraenolepis orangiensis TaxID=630683 RepID=A0A9Q0E8R9_9TELE|nr:hypothetical protein NHX12_031923 [Muraenolepis orangiensis]
MALSPTATAARRVFAAASQSSHQGGAKTWKWVSILLGFPSVAICMANAYVKGNAHSHDQPPFVPYTHLRLRSKKFPWGDGNHSLFHNSHANALPDGYHHTRH